MLYRSIVYRSSKDIEALVGRSFSVEGTAKGMRVFLDTGKGFLCTKESESGEYGCVPDEFDGEELTVWSEEKK